jgi:hypothetical protein
MSQAFVLELAGLAARSLVIAILAAIFARRMRSVVRTHALWMVVLVVMLLMPLADRIMPQLRLPFPARAAVPAATYRSPFNPNISMPTLSLPESAEVATAKREWYVRPWTVAAVVYAVIALALALQTVLAYYRLHRLRATGRTIATASFPVVADNS